MDLPQFRKGLSRVVQTGLFAEGHRNSRRRGVHTFRRDVLECGHTVEIGWGRSIKRVAYRRCEECAAERHIRLKAGGIEPGDGK